MDTKKEPLARGLVGVRLWEADVDFEYRVGCKTFLEHENFNSIVQQHRAQLNSLQKIIEYAPHARDAGSAVERVLRFHLVLCIHCLFNICFYCVCVIYSVFMLIVVIPMCLFTLPDSTTNN